MLIRSLDILDIPGLSHYRRDVLPLDSARILTRGNPLGARAMLSYLNPRRSIHTAVASGNNDSLMGQVLLYEDTTSARLTFLAPAEMINGLTAPLVDHLTQQAGDWGALHLLAEVDENSPAFKPLRQAGFTMYAWQRVWKLPRLEPAQEANTWYEALEIDWPAVQYLHGQIVPALLQPIENLPRQACGLVCRPQGGLQAYVSVTSGAHGVWLQPLVPPDSGCSPERLAGLSGMVSGWSSRPVYLCVRSYQAWLEPVLEELGAQPVLRQAVMVRRLAVPIKESQTVPVMEQVLAKAKPAAPVSRADGER